MTTKSSTIQVVDPQQRDPSYRSEIQELICRASADQGEKQESIFTDNMSVAFEGKCFQFSGMLEFGKRQDAISVVERLGGYAPSGSSLPSLVNYLVVGDLEKRARRRNGYGGNITKAMSLNRKAPQQIQIISERYFVKAVVKSLYKYKIRETSITSTRFTYRSLLDKASKANNLRSTAIHFV